MKKTSDTRLIGLFVIGALGLIVLMLMFLGGGRYLSTSQKYVTYFQGSVHGLNPGAPVKLKGVTVGRVVDIQLQYDVEHNRVLTPVITQIDFDKISETRGQGSFSRKLGLTELIEHGLRARLNQNSMLTGQLYVELAFMPKEQPPILMEQGAISYPEIPTTPSSRDQIENLVEKAMTDFKDLPIKETVATTLQTLQTLETLLAAPETRGSITNLNQTLIDLQHLIRHLDGKVEVLTESLQATAKTINKTANSIEGTAKESEKLVKNLNQQIPPLLSNADQTLNAIAATFNHAKGTLNSVDTLASEPDSELNTALKEIAEAARSLRLMAETLERHPEAVLYGKKPRQ